MHRLRFCALGALLLAPAALFGQTTTTSGVLSIGGGTALQQGDRAAFQEVTQHHKQGYGGIEEYRLVREGDDDLFTFDARILVGDENYRIAGRYEKLEKYYVDAGYSQFRIWSDGSGGYFRPSATAFDLFDAELAVDRSTLWLEVGLYTPAQTLIRLRYQRATRDGTKGTTHWGDTNLVGAPYGTRSIVPGFYDLDETTDTVTLDVGNDTAEDQKWNVGARYSETSHDNKRYNRRRPFESADRIITTKDQSSSDLFAAHGYYLRKVNEKLTLSGGALITKLDTHIAGSRIYGQSYDPVFDPVFLRRQQRDEGFYDLDGSADLKQTVLNFNAVYTPHKHWTIRPSVRFENLRQDTMAEFLETNFGGAPAFAAVVEHAESSHQKDWNEWSEALNVRYTGLANWSFSADANWVQGTGTLEEELLVHGAARIDRDMDNERSSQKYSLNANWYARPGLTFAAQYYYKDNASEFKAMRDNTPATGGDRYPAFITHLDFQTHDVNARVSWRPVSGLSLVSRYDYQQSTIKSIEAGLSEVQNADITAHIFSQSITWSATPRLYFTASGNVTYDQLKTPAVAFVQNSDNNYVNTTIGAGYVLSEIDDLFLDYSYYRASNFSDNSQLSLPLGAGEKQQAAYLTWKRRHSPTLIYTLKYGYLTNRDETWAGQNDFDAHVIYGRVQYLF